MCGQSGAKGTSNYNITVPGSCILARLISLHHNCHAAATQTAGPWSTVQPVRPVDYATIISRLLLILLTWRLHAGRFHDSPWSAELRLLPRPAVTGRCAARCFSPAYHESEHHMHSTHAASDLRWTRAPQGLLVLVLPVVLVLVLPVATALPLPPSWCVAAGPRLRSTGTILALDCRMLLRSVVNCELGPAAAQQL